ncbi:MAG: ABC transporter ATP-binding protein [bacterium]
MRIEINGVCFAYGSRPALKDVSVKVKGEEVISILGPNGSGKSTLLKCINKILKPQKGVIYLDGNETSKFKQKELAKLLGYVPQSSSYSFPLTVFDAVLLGRKPYITWSISFKDKEIVSQILKEMNLEDMMLRYFNELSGGEKQKVLLARALAQEPEVLLLDEPTSNLDLRHQLEVMELISSLAKKKAIAIVMAIHDLNLASRFSDRMLFLTKGKIFAIGQPKEVFTPENIREVYGVEAIISKASVSPYIIPIKSLS